MPGIGYTADIVRDCHSGNLDLCVDFGGGVQSSYSIGTTREDKRCQYYGYYFVHGLCTI